MRVGCIVMPLSVIVIGFNVYKLGDYGVRMVNNLRCKVIPRIRLAIWAFKGSMMGGSKSRCHYTGSCHVSMRYCSLRGLKDLTGPSERIINDSMLFKKNQVYV